MGELDSKKRDQLPAGEFAFPKKRKLPINDAAHVRGASARFNQVEGVTADEKKKAKARIESAAKKKGVKLSKAPD